MKAKVLLLLGLLLLTTYLSANRYLWDDAVITYRFCQNLLLGKGLVAYDNGPPVEGYSNPSLVFLTAGIAKIIGKTDLTNIMRIGLYLNILALFLCACLLLFWGKRDWSWIGGFALILFYPTHLYRQCGLETWLYTFFFTLAIYGFAKKKYNLALCASLLTALSRPEGIGLAVWLIVVYLLIERKNWKKEIGKIICWIVIPFGIFLLWRYWYFGHFLSMSSIAKSHLKAENSFSFAGFNYLLKGYVAAPFLVLLSLLTLTRFIRNHRDCYYEITGLAFQLFFIFAVGGDEIFFLQYRFLVPIFPLLFRSLGLIPDIMPRYKSLAATILVVLAFLTPAFEQWRNKLEIHLAENLYNEITGIKVKNRWRALLNPEPWPEDERMSRYLRDHVPEAGKGLILASVQGGGLPLHWRGIFYDVAGLMTYDYAVAGRKGRGKVFFRNLPDIYAVIHSGYEIPTENIVFPAWSDYPGLYSLDKLGYRPTLLFLAKYPPIAKRGHIYETNTANGFLLFTKDPNLINIEKYSFKMDVRYNGKLIKTPVIIVQIPA